MKKSIANERIQYDDMAPDFIELIIGHGVGIYPAKDSEELRGKISIMQEVCIHAMASLAGICADEEGGHIVRTQYYVQALANQLMEDNKFPEVLTPENILLISKSALIHDIGKIGIPDYILMKPTLLTQQEFDIMKTHTSLGYNSILRAEKLFGEQCNPFLNFAKEVVYSHHERWDGTGYPLGLSGEHIPLSARLMALADVYDAITCKRVYKEAFSHEHACYMIRENAGVHFDPCIVEAFLSIKAQFKEISEQYANGHEPVHFSETEI